jgi:hypothetical protein
VPSVTSPQVPARVPVVNCTRVGVTAHPQHTPSKHAPGAAAPFAMNLFGSSFLIEAPPNTEQYRSVPTLSATPTVLGRSSSVIPVSWRRP